MTDLVPHHRALEPEVNSVFSLLYSTSANSWKLSFTSKVIDE